ncbi:ABC transporter ATP-binding protein [Aliivibrio fischeri]|uniref:Multidrug resistance ABC transporter ATP-binding and permease protein n=1 Tax=Aliivibrio fischeri (strain ATCC 700601 / ES114) TaxID=312309 RepID=Q5E067_ALIF1|nr:ABC transporter ATP-binding protein [Aliivibrio fischeri]AAW87579.1 multidrug resistance ABC transporter ATP-binding and permease protein [Aliivibrio fischeri ES114]KLU78257.1 multidrug ABC transporter ATP-binding protein [Aliivibrio fischeri]MBP3139129.1 ABC transporter ATP-binding protein [Aliivibrio fischeri]MBP3154719.1 ABC transporter ATP-binding protein [Aliivibrio fischeri]MCE7574625.1 ABC transporter ATP-binding protein/permease [Aliivibrio fischeri]
MFKFFERLTTAFPEQEPNQPPKGLYAFCRHYTKGFEVPLIGMSLLSAVIAMIEVSLFGFMGQLVDWLSTHDRETFLAQEGQTLLLLGFLIVVIVPILLFIHSLLTHQTLLGNYPMAIRWQAHRYLLKQSVSFYSDDFAGRIATKVMQTALAVRETVMKLLDVLVYVSVYFTSMVVMVGQADWRLMLPMLVWFAAYVAIQFHFVPKLKAISEQQADARSTMTGRVVDSYTNINTVKLFSHSKRETQYAEEGMEEFLGTVHKQMRLATGINISVEIINYLLVFSIAAVSITLWLDNVLSVGAIAIAISLALRVNGMSHWIMWEISSLFENLGTVTDGINTLSKPIEITDKENASELNVSKGTIKFDSVNFNYGENKSVINDLNLEIKPGEKIGLVGRSGAGKSTLVNLLLRFHDVESGSISIDGQDIRDVTQDSLRSQIGMVSQDTSLLHRSIRDNIKYGRPDATDEDLFAATKQAQAHEFIETLTDSFGSKGYDAQVGERGVKLSGGQRQRIAISRVLLKDAPLLILDEATSALDSEVEAAIQDSLDELMEGKTVIAIAHRLSTIAAMDRLLVMDKGQVVEQGTHKELVALGGIYAQLWNHQTGGFISE